MPAHEVLVRGVVVGRVTSLGPSRWVALDDDLGSVCVRPSDEAALASLHEGRRHEIRRDVVDTLAMSAVVRADPAVPETLVLVAHGLALSPDGHGSHVTVGMCDSVGLHASEADAVMSLVPEILWRAGWLGGDYPRLDHARASRVRARIPELLRQA